MERSGQKTLVIILQNYDYNTYINIYPYFYLFETVIEWFGLEGPFKDHLI